MKFHQLSLLLIALLICQCKTSKTLSPSNNIKSEIDQNIKTYFEYLNRKDVDGAMNFIHPKLFEIVPRELMVGSFEQLFTDTTYTFSFDSLVVNAITEPITVEGSKYAKVDYDGYMTMHLLGEPDESFISILKMGLHAQFGEEHVQYNAAKSGLFPYTAPNP